MAAKQSKPLPPPDYAPPPKDATSKERTWFPKEESVALGLLGLICDADGKYTLEDLVFRMGCNCVSAAGALWQLRTVGYIERKREDDRIESTANHKWGRNRLRSTPRGRSRLAKHREELRKLRERNDKA